MVEGRGQCRGEGKWKTLRGEEIRDRVEVGQRKEIGKSEARGKRREEEGRGTRE
jgi:hypothetical protein